MDTCPKCGYAMQPFDTECVRCRNLAEQAKQAPPSPPAVYPTLPPSFAHLPQNAFADKVNNSGRNKTPPPQVQMMGFCWGAFGLGWVWGVALA
jgi:hypothetical protein